MIYLDQRQARETVRPFDLSDRGVLLADGVFDTSMVLNGKVVFRDAHFARLQEDAAALGIKIDQARLETAVRAVVPEGGNGSLRLTVTRGTGQRGLAPYPHSMPTVLARFGPLDSKYVLAPVDLGTARIRRNETSPSARHKTLAYLDAVMALREATEGGFDEALFLNTSGNVACCAAGNLFALNNGKLLTPPIEDGVLAGIVRAWILEHAGEIGLSAEVCSLTPADIEKAEALIMTNSLRLIAPVTRLDGWTYTALSAPVSALMRGLLDHIGAACGQAPFNVPEVTPTITAG